VETAESAQCLPCGRFRQGLIDIKAVCQETEVAWTTRYSSRVPLVGDLLRPAIQVVLNGMLNKGLKPYAERLSKA